MESGAVTVMGGVFGIAAGHFYFYRSLVLNFVGWGFHVVANIFDNADGQLARPEAAQAHGGRL